MITTLANVKRQVYSARQEGSRAPSLEKRPFGAWFWSTKDKSTGMIPVKAGLEEKRVITPISNLQKQKSFAKAVNMPQRTAPSCASRYIGMLYLHLEVRKRTLNKVSNPIELLSPSQPHMADWHTRKTAGVCGSRQGNLFQVLGCLIGQLRE